MKECKECDQYFEPSESITKTVCDSCRMRMAPCLECGANDEYQADKDCLCSGDKDSCHGNQLWG